MTAPIDLLTDADITEALRLAAAATPGPWRVSCHSNVQGLPSRLGTCQQIADVDPLREGEIGNREADAALIVAARTLLPAGAADLADLRAAARVAVEAWDSGRLNVATSAAFDRLRGLVKS